MRVEFKFEKVAHKPYCEKELKTLLEDLKNEFPDIFTFNIWDKNGIQIKSLSDDNNFLFLYRKLNNLLNTIKAETVLNTQNSRDFVAECDSELRLLRQIIGPSLFPDSYLKNSILINLGKHRRMVPEQYLEDDNYLNCWRGCMILFIEPKRKSNERL